MCGLGEPGETLAHSVVLFELSQCHECADRQASAVERNTVETGNILEIDKTNRTRRVVFHRRQKILPARNRTRRVVNIAGRTAKHFHSFVNVCRISPLKRFHLLILFYPRLSIFGFINPIRILSGVTGVSRTRTPVALKTAFTSAPTAGMMQPSAIPITASRLSSSSISGTISGIWRLQGNL